MIALKFGLYAASVMIALLKLGMAEHLFIHIMLLAQHLLNGLAINSGSRQCGKENLIKWLLICSLKALNLHLMKIKNGIRKR